MATTDTATLLEDAADRIADVSRPDLQDNAPPRRAVVAKLWIDRFRDDIEEALRDLSGEFGKTRNDTVRGIACDVQRRGGPAPSHRPLINIYRTNVEEIGRELLAEGFARPATQNGGTTGATEPGPSTIRH